MSDQSSLCAVRIEVLRLVHLYDSVSGSGKRALRPGQVVDASVSAKGWLTIPSEENYGLPIRAPPGRSYRPPDYGSWQAAWEEEAIRLSVPTWAEVEDSAELEAIADKAAA